MLTFRTSRFDAYKRKVVMRSRKPKVRYFKRPNRLQSLTAIFVFLCICGFCFQVYDLASTYFAYKTGTSVDIAMPDRLVTPNVSFCIRYWDIYHGPKPKNNLTIADIFNGTPHASSLLSMCIHRHVKSYEAKIINSSAGCNSQFEIDKFYIAEYVCYRFQKDMTDLKHGAMQRFSYQNIANSLIYQGLFYGLFIDLNAIKRADLCKVVVHAQGSWPHAAISTSPYFHRFSGNDAKYNLVRATYSTIEIVRMPAPYDTQCIVYTAGGQKGCENQCVRDGTIQVFNKVPFTTIEREAVEVGHIGRSIIAKRNNTNILNALEEKCQKACSHSECDSLFFTTSILKEEKGDYDLFSILVQAPITPRIKVSRHPSSQLADFLVYVTSCFGTWFGISVLSLNPFPLIFREKEKECRSCDDCLQAMSGLFDEIRLIKSNI